MAEGFSADENVRSDIDYPPQPWHLAGTAHVSVWRLSPTNLPTLPTGLHPVVIAGKAQVVTAWIAYEPPGELSYHELLSTVSVRNGLTPTVSITEIWVDSAVSRAGGRALWGIPKEMAALDFQPGKTFTASAATERDWIATSAFTRRAGLPVALPAEFRIVQNLGGTLKYSPVKAKGKPTLATSTWNINPRGPLGYLAGQTPVLNLQLREFDLRFGG